MSSGETEYYAFIRGACTSLGIQSHYQDWMTDVPTQIYSGSSAARSVARRRGIGGRLGHLQTRHFWLQSRAALGHLKLDVVAGEQNPADRSRHCQVERFASGQNMLVKDGCGNHDDSNSKLEKCCVVENERTMMTESENAERQRSRVRSKGQVLEWHRVTQGIWKRRGS